MEYKLFEKKKKKKKKKKKIKKKKKKKKKKKRVYNNFWFLIEFKNSVPQMNYLYMFHF